MNANKVLIAVPHPEDIYLCQVNECISCSACCGLYNRADASKHALEKILSDRTETFLRVERTMESILEFGREIELRESNIRRYYDFHHCPYIGLLGVEHSRVGCLLHPRSEGNNEIDYRGLSYYGGMACNTYFCPAGQHLSPEIKLIVQHAADDWYVYGLMITERALLEAFFKEIQYRLGRSITPWDFKDNPKGIKAVRDVLYLKVNWPFRSENDQGLCHYFFKDRKYQKPPVAYRNCDIFLSRYHKIFQELISSFDSADSLNQAESIIDTYLNNVVRCIPH